MSLPVLEPHQPIIPAEEMGSLSHLLSELGHGQQPVALVLTCWELGFAPDQVSTANPGEVMVVQNPGGLVPDVNTEGDEATLGSVLYGLHQPTVRHLVACGHTHCGTLGLLLGEEKQRRQHPLHKPMDNVQQRLQTAYCNDRPVQDWLGLLVQESILQQLANLRSHPFIRSRLQQGNLFLHGWIRDDQTSAIRAYDPSLGQFCD